MLLSARKLYVGRKVICVRCLNCSFNNVAKSIRLLDKKSHFCLYRKKFIQLNAFESSIPLEVYLFCASSNLFGSCNHSCDVISGIRKQYPLDCFPTWFICLQKMVNPYPAKVFVLAMSSAYYVCCVFLRHFRALLPWNQTLRIQIRLLLRQS